MTEERDTLKACRICGAACSVQAFPAGVTLERETLLWVCSDHAKLGGDCPSDIAYLTAAAWNGRPEHLDTLTDSGADVERDMIARIVAETRFDQNVPCDQFDTTVADRIIAALRSTPNEPASS